MTPTPDPYANWRQRCADVVLLLIIIILFAWLFYSAPQNGKRERSAQANNSSAVSIAANPTSLSFAVPLSKKDRASFGETRLGSAGSNTKSSVSLTLFPQRKSGPVVMPLPASNLLTSSFNSEAESKKGVASLPQK